MKNGAEIVRGAAGVILRPEVRTLEFTGADRIRFLNGMLSNDITKLAPGRGQLAVKASNKGRIEGLVRVRMREVALDLDLLEVVAPKVLETLEKFIVMDEVTVRDRSGERDVLGLYGPASKEVLARAGLGVGELEPLSFEEAGAVTIVRDVWLGVDGYELHVPPGEAGTFQARLVEAGAQLVDAASIDALRIEAGVPLDGIDLGEDTIPLEARLERAIDFEKGCYIGQETISRASNLGQVRHVLVGLDIGGAEPPPRGARILSSGKTTGEVTSSVRSPTLDRLIGLGYVRSTDDLVGNWMTIESNGASWDATIAALPFVPPTTG